MPGGAFAISAVDAHACHAVEAAVDATSTVASLAAHLAALPSVDARELLLLARAAFRWIAHHIVVDPAAASRRTPCVHASVTDSGII